MFAKPTPASITEANTNAVNVVHSLPNMTVSMYFPCYLSEYNEAKDSFLFPQSKEKANAQTALPSITGALPAYSFFDMSLCAVGLLLTCLLFSWA
eukprot:scaffold135683_cov16-Prasinocladus_malaysianus.AAC.1